MGPLQAAQEPFRTRPHLTQHPLPFSHLSWSGLGAGAVDIKRLRVKLIREGKTTMFSTSDLKHLHWTPYQQFARHAASGCDKQTADLIGIGTMSGSGRNDQGEMLELDCHYEAKRMKSNVMPLSLSLSLYNKTFFPQFPGNPFRSHKFFFYQPTCHSTCANVAYSINPSYEEHIPKQPRHLFEQPPNRVSRP